jgi:hypothetical protein
VVEAGGSQADPGWNLDRVDQRSRTPDRRYTWMSTGAGVTAYVVDTGIRASHYDLVGRVLPGVETVGDGRGTADCNGHGTHVAGILGGTKWGVAKNVRLVPVRVLGCSGRGSTSGVIAGLDWVTARNAGPGSKRAVVNMSLGAGVSEALDEAVARSIAQGVTYVIAAGNDGGNACHIQSPARVSATTSAITVGATTRTDARAAWSNLGGCVRLFAPGDGVTSAWHTADGATQTLSGTSMAAPHVAGAAALLLEQHLLSPRQVRDRLEGLATTGAVTDAGPGSPNRLLYTLPFGHDPVGSIDGVVGQQTNMIAIRGWTIDHDVPTIHTQVHVYIDGPAGSGARGVAMLANVARPDVGAAYHHAGNAHGYSWSIGGVTPGSHTLYIYAVNAGGPGGNPLLGTREVHVPAADTGTPVGAFADAVAEGNGGARIRGWALDPDVPDKPLAVHVYVDGWAGSGAPGVALTAGVARGDVGAHGFDTTIGLGRGTHTLYAYAINAPGTTGHNPLLGTRDVYIP